MPPRGGIRENPRRRLREPSASLVPSELIAHDEPDAGRELPRRLLVRPCELYLVEEQRPGARCHEDPLRRDGHHLTWRSDRSLVERLCAPHEQLLFVWRAQALDEAP